MSEPSPSLVAQQGAILMERNFVTRLLHRGHKFLRGRRRNTRWVSPSFLSLETLEDRRLLAAGLGGLNVFQHLAPVTIEITIQQPTVVRQPSVSITLSSPSGGEGLFSFLGSLGLGSQSGNTNPSGNSEGGGLLGGLLPPVTSTVDGLLNSVVNPVTSTVGSVLHGTQPVATTTTTVLPVTLPVVPTLPASPAPPNPLPAPVLPSVPVTVSAPAPIRTSATVSLSSGASSTPGLLPSPEVPPTIEAPAAPVNTAPIFPSVPDPAPATPAIPPGAQVARLVPPLVAPALSAPNSAAVTSQIINAQTAAQLGNAGSVRSQGIDFALLLGSSTSVVPAVNSVPESESAAPLSGRSLEAGQSEASLAASALSGGIFTDLETYLFADDGDVPPERSVPDGTTDVPLSRGEWNEVTPSQSAGQGATLIGASDEILTQVAVETTQKLAEAGKELLKPTAHPWMRFVAPLFVAAGAYLATRFSRRKKTNERRLELALGR
jgi:hypothetical protein